MQASAGSKSALAPREGSSLTRFSRRSVPTDFPQNQPDKWSSEKRDGAAIEKAAAKLGELYGFLEAALAKTDYIGGPELTLCDIAIGVHAHRWFSFEGDDISQVYGRPMADVFGANGFPGSRRELPLAFNGDEVRFGKVEATFATA